MVFLFFLFFFVGVSLSWNNNEVDEFFVMLV